MSDMVWVRRADLTASFVIDLHTCLRFEWCNYLNIAEALMHPSDALQRCYRSPDGKWIREWPTSELESEESLDLPHPRISYEYFECDAIDIARDIFTKYRLGNIEDDTEPLPSSEWYLPPELESCRSIASDEIRYRRWRDEKRASTPMKPSWNEEHQTLFMFGGPYRRFTKLQRNYQVAILRAFEQEGWPPWIRSPLNNPSRLKDTVKSFNKESKNGFRLRANADGRQVGWTLSHLPSHLP